MWGEDSVILERIELVDHSQAVALTYVEAYTLRRSDLETLLREFPAEADFIRRAGRRITIQRALLTYLCRYIKNKQTPASFVPKSAARGATTVNDVLSLEQKIDANTKQMEKFVSRFGVSVFDADAEPDSPGKARENAAASPNLSHSPRPHAGDGSRRADSLTYSTPGSLDAVVAALHTQRNDMESMQKEISTLRCARGYPPLHRGRVWRLSGI